MKKKLLIELAVGFFMVGMVGMANANVITLQSGLGILPGNNDPAVTMLVGPDDEPFTSALTSADFAAAKEGPNALVINNLYSWKSHLDSYPNAKWITDQSRKHTALYAINFTIGAGLITSATLDFDFLVDNQIGDTNNEGLFINEVPLLGSKFLYNYSGDSYRYDQSFSQFDITSLLNNGINTLYINAADRGGPSGLQFGAKINYTLGSSVPEPTSMLIFGTGLIGLVGTRIRRKKNK